MANPYISSYERHFLEKGRQEILTFVQESLAFAIEMKFGISDSSISEQLRQIPNVERLREIQQFVRAAKTLEEVPRATPMNFYQGV